MVHHTTRTLTWLLLRALLLKEPATVVDTVPMPTLSALRSPIRPRDEMCLFITSSLALAREWHAARVSHQWQVKSREVFVCA